MKISISDWKTMGKPCQEAIYKIDYDVANNAKDWGLAELQNHVKTGGHFSCGYINTPILSNDLKPLIVNQEDFDKLKNGEISEDIKTRKLENLKQEEVGRPIIRRREVCWTSQSIFGLDIDNSKIPLSSKNAIERAKDIGNPVCFLYNTFTSKEIKKGVRNPEKYRMIFQTKEPITDYRVAKIVNLALMILFPESDPATKDLNRVFYGTGKGKKAKIQPNNFMNLEQLFIELHDYFKNKDSKNYSRNMTKFCKDNGLSMFNNVPAITSNQDIISQFDKQEEYIVKSNGVTFVFDALEIEMKYKNFKAERTIDKITGKEITKIKTTGNFIIYEDVDFDELENKCELAKIFAKGEEEIAHQNLMRLISNLIHIKGGQQYFLDNLEYGANNFEYTKMANEMQKTIAYEHQPWRCDNNVDKCIYFDTCNNFGKNMLDKVILKQGQIRKIENKNDGLTIAEAEIELKKIMIEFNESDFFNNIKIIKAPTGIGKTKLYIELCQAGDIIVSPTHDLDSQIAFDLKKLGKDYIIATKRPNLIDESDREYFEILLKIGNVRSASALYLKKTQEYLMLDIITKKHKECIDWIKQQEELKTTTKIIIATHAKLQTINNPNTKTVWVDEDIFDVCLINQKNIKLSDLILFLDCLKDELGIDLGAEIEVENFYKKIENFIKELKDGIKKQCNVIRPILNLSAKEKELIEKLIRKNIRQYKSSISSIFAIKNYKDDAENKLVFIPNFTTKTLTLTNINKDIFKSNLNYVVMSATINEIIWKNMFPKCEFKEIKLKSNDQIKLYYKESASRKKLENNKDFIDYVKDVIGVDMPIITFKKTKDDLTKNGFKNVQQDMHIGKTAGMNTLTGQDIAVIGTPHLNSNAYVAVNAVLENDCSDLSMQYRKINRNGYEFFFFTYCDVDLREIQMHMIEVELIQAIGRARSNRTDANVYVFSNLPVTGCVLVNPYI